MIHWIPLINAANLWVQGAFAAAVTIYALARGGAAARGAAIIAAAGWIVAGISNFLIQPIGLRVIVTCTQDALVAAGFLYLAIRHNSGWLILGVIVQGLQLGLDFLLISEWAHMGWRSRFASGVVLNGLSFGLLFCVLGVAMAERRRLALAGPVRV